MSTLFFTIEPFRAIRSLRSFTIIAEQMATGVPAMIGEQRLTRISIIIGEQKVTEMMGEQTVIGIATLISEAY